jgi:hypothetical protein
MAHSFVIEVSLAVGLCYAYTTRLVAMWWGAREGGREAPHNLTIPARA